ncbi:MAG: hypothetical protein ACM3JI_02760 [Anaerolineae bacterium]
MKKIRKTTRHLLKFLKYKTLRISLVALAAFLFIPQVKEFCDKQTDGFSIAKISADLPFNPDWDVAPLSLEENSRVEKILQQPFHYLASGGQCYAFESEDGRYVLKFFKLHRRLVPRFLSSLPLPKNLKKRLSKTISERRAKLCRDFNSHKLVYEELKEESGLLFVHLNTTQSLKKKLLIIDKLNIAHPLNADEHFFVLQKKAELVFPYFQELMEQNDIEQAKKAIHLMLKVLVARCQKGIYDEDPRLHRNFGFASGKAIFIDVGRFRKDPSRTSVAIYHQDLLSIVKRFKLWLQTDYPALSTCLEEELHEIEKNS